MSSSKYAKRLRALGFHWFSLADLGTISINNVPVPPRPPPVPREVPAFRYILNFFGNSMTGVIDELGETWIHFSKHIDLEKKMGFKRLPDNDVGQPERLQITVTTGDAE